VNEGAPEATRAGFICPECGARADEAGRCPRDGTPREALADDPLLGQTVGRWTVTGLIGAGGAGRVYRGVQPEIGSRVAIKVLTRQAAENREAVERFFAEARAVNLIRHEGIVQVLDLAFLDDGQPYIVMEHLDGASLARVIAARGALPLGAVAAWAREALDALAVAHARGIVHRDLKPANLWVTPAGHARVLDFGLAKLAPGLDARPMTTRSGLLMGTPHYMAPEQADARPVDARADLYALGVVLYEAGTGVRPFDAPSLYELLRQHVEDTPVPPRQRRPDMPAALDKVIRRALEKDPGKRWASAPEMAEALADAVKGLPPASFEPLRPPPPGGGVDPTASTVISAGHTPPTRSDAQTRLRTRVFPASYRTAAVVAGLIALGGVAVVLARGVRRGTEAPVAVPGAVADAGAPPPADAAEPVALATPPDAAPVAAGPPDAGTRAALAPTRVRPDAGAGAGPGPGTPGAGPTVVRKKPDAGTPPATDGKGPPIIVEPVLPDVERWRRGEERRIPGPADPTKFDLVGYIPTVTKLAREVFPDAELVMTYATWIRADGIMDLTEKGEAGYLFRTPSMQGQDARCYLMFRIYAKSGEMRAQLPTNPGDLCAWPVAPTPSCRPGDVWKRALEQGAPADGRAYMRYLVRNGQGRWEFTLMGGGLDFKAVDQCP
jgi:serine/threonine-protein kinase